MFDCPMLRGDTPTQIPRKAYRGHWFVVADTPSSCRVVDGIAIKAQMTFWPLCFASRGLEAGLNLVPFYSPGHCSLVPRQEVA